MAGRPTARACCRHTDVSMPFYSFSLKVVPIVGKGDLQVVAGSWISCHVALCIAFRAGRCGEGSKAWSYEMRLASSLHGLPLSVLTHCCVIFSGSNQTFKTEIHRAYRCAYNTRDKLALKCKLHQKALPCGGAQI